MSTFLCRTHLFFGRGLALEAYFSFLTLTTFLLYAIAMPSTITQEAVFEDLLKILPSSVTLMPFLMIGTFQFLGLIANYRGFETSWIPRYIAAIMAVMLWSGLLTQSIAMGSYSIIVPLSVTALIANLWIAWKAWNRLPIPGPGTHSGQ